MKERDIELKRALEYIEDVEQQNANYVKELRSFELQITSKSRDFSIRRDSFSLLFVVWYVQL